MTRIIIFRSKVWEVDIFAGTQINVQTISGIAYEKEWRCSPFSPHKKLKKKIQYAANKEHWTTFEALSPFLTFLLIQLVLWFRVLAAHHKLDTQEIHWYALLVCSASFPDCVGKCDITAQNKLINHTSFMYIYIYIFIA